MYAIELTTPRGRKFWATKTDGTRKTFLNKVNAEFEARRLAQYANAKVVEV